MAEEKLFEKVEKLLGKKKTMLDTTQHESVKAYTLAADKYLMEDGDLKYDKLNDNETQKKFSKFIADHYTDVAKKKLKAEGGDDFQDEMLVKAYWGISSKHLKDVIGKYGSQYTHDLHGKQTAGLMEKQDQELSGIAFGDLKEEHIEAGVKHVGAKHLDHKKMDLSDLAEVLDMKHKYGAVTKEMTKGKKYHKG